MFYYEKIEYYGMYFTDMKAQKKLYDKISDTRLYRILSDIADGLNEAWCIKSIFELMPTLFGLFFQFFPSILDGKGESAKWKVYIFLISCMFSFVIILLTNYKSVRDLARNSLFEDKLASYDGILTTRKAVSTAETSLEEEFVRFLRDYIHDNEILSEDIIEYVKNAYSPKKRIDAILD